MTQNITFSAPSQWTDLSGKRPRNWRATGDTGKRRELRGQVIRCAQPGCGEATWAASPEAWTLARWTVEHYPDCCWCPKCRPKAKPEPQPAKPAAKAPARTGQGGRVAFEIGTCVVLKWDACQLVGVITDRRTVGGGVRYKVEYPEGAVCYAKASDLRAVNVSVTEKTDAVSS